MSLDPEHTVRLDAVTRQVVTNYPHPRSDNPANDPTVTATVTLDDGKHRVHIIASVGDTVTETLVQAPDAWGEPTIEGASIETPEPCEWVPVTRNWETETEAEV